MREVAFFVGSAALMATAVWLVLPSRAEKAAATIRRRLNGLRRNRLGPAPEEQVDAAGSSRLLGYLGSRFAMAGLNAGPYLLYSIASLAVCVLATAIAGGPLAGALTLLGGVVAGNLLLNFLARRASERFLEALPGFTERLQHLLASGSALSQAFERALSHADTESSLVKTLSPVLRRIENGMPIAEALEIKARRLRSRELAILAVTAQANLRFGGTLSSSLGHYTQILQDRSRVKREMRALSAETRASSKVLFALPITVAALILYSNPQYLTFFLDHENGPYFLGYIIASNVLGLAIMRRLGRVEF